MNTWRSRYVFVAFLAAGLFLVGVLIFFTRALIAEHYFEAACGAVGIFSGVVCGQIIGSEMRYRARLWDRRWRVWRGQL